MTEVIKKESTLIKAIIFTDLDESLLKDNKYYAVILDKFIKKIVLKKYLIIVITSKTFDEVKALYKNNNISFSFSSENGASFNILDKKFLNKYSFKRIINKNAITVSEIKRRLNSVPTRYQEHFKFISDLNIKDQIKITKLEEWQLNDFHNREFSVSLSWYGNKTIYLKFKKKLKQLKLKATFGGRIINVSGLHSKLDAVKFYNNYFSKLYNIRNFKTISIGDSENDIEMLNYSDYSGIVKREDKKNIMLNKDHNVFNSSSPAPYGWVEIVDLVIKKMEDKNS